ncbi:aminoglycoside adenylyltransferase domain-containing protein [Sporosarcina sp. E16_8]|uniref:aminoglycoside adenylyltransferase domain-containing protein n=1 Tax=Sporosarcina sp. E16_8 TaxID=2789295 RepID=UPI001A90F9B0|nr:aminoglycoside adenylyltransferase domain-containing protein [Sporosarcina sp. E16_8]MBO0586917.1 DUF4111 domain-containing protein [Sporosarcina sp. E16_8]
MRKIPAVVQNVLNDYIDLLHQLLPNTLEGLYIHGSIALNAYVNDSSDIDFIAIINRRLSKSEVGVLSEIHGMIASNYQNPKMDGAYIMWEDIGKLDAADNKYPFYNGGTLSFGAYFNSITWWILKTSGISIIGPEPTALRIEVDPLHLVSYVSENMNTYWEQRIRKIESSIEQIPQLATEEIDIEIEWSVLGLLRQYYTLKEHSIVSKLGAGEYALLHMPEEWHQIIREAINVRKGVKTEIFISDEERIDMALRFSKYIIRYCNRCFIQKHRV